MPSQQLLIPVLVFVAVAVIGAAVTLPRVARRAALRPRLKEPGQSTGGIDDRDQASRTPSLLDAVGRIVSFGRPTEDLRKDLAYAGFHKGFSAEAYIGAKILLLILGLGAALAAVMPLTMATSGKTVIVLAGGAVLSFIPNFIVSSRRRRRRKEVRSALPDATDLLEICVSSGMGMDMAWNAVADEIRRVSNVTADEMALTNLEIQLGSPRATAMRNMSERTGAQELASLVAVMLQSERFGTSISDALRQFAESMREARSARAEEAAEKMAVKLLIPMVLFIFPAMLIVMVGPAAIRLVSVMGK